MRQKRVSGRIVSIVFLQLFLLVSLSFSISFVLSKDVFVSAVDPPADWMTSVGAGVKANVRYYDSTTATTGVVNSAGARAVEIPSTLPTPSKSNPAASLSPATQPATQPSVGNVDGKKTPEVSSGGVKPDPQKPNELPPPVATFADQVNSLRS